MFTPDERRQLRLIEEWFERDDPQLANTLRSGPVKRRSAATRTIVVAVAAVLALLGIVTGVFVVIFAAAVAAVAGGYLIAGSRTDNPGESTGRRH